MSVLPSPHATFSFFLQDEDKYIYLKNSIDKIYLELFLCVQHCAFFTISFNLPEMGLKYYTIVTPSDTETGLQQ